MTDEEKAMLDFAGEFFRHSGNQHEAIREKFDMTVTRYWQRVNQLCDTEAALAYDPALVRRLQRIRGGRETGRAARTDLARGA